MAKMPDSDRILRLLSESEGLSNLRIRTALNLSDERYATVREKLLDDGLVEKLRMRGGGIRLTRKGEKASPDYDGIDSTVDKEADLYPPLVSFLEKQAREDEVQAVVCSTHSLKARGQWQNPDVTRVSIEYYKHLRKSRVTVTPYEVKQFPNWNIGVVFEAASHHRFSHEAYVVLEWPDDLDFDLTDPTYRLNQISRECQRFGVGLATLSKYYNSYRLQIRLEPKPSAPFDEDVETWLDYALSRNATALADFDDKMRSVQNVVASGNGLRISTGQK